MCMFEFKVHVLNYKSGLICTCVLVAFVRKVIDKKLFYHEINNIGITSGLVSKNWFIKILKKKASISGLEFKFVHTYDSWEPTLADANLKWKSLSVYPFMFLLFIQIMLM